MENFSVSLTYTATRERKETANKNLLEGIFFRKRNEIYLWQYVEEKDRNTYHTHNR